MVIAAVLPQRAGAQQAPSGAGQPVPVEFSTDSDLHVFAGFTMRFDPGQVLYSQPRPVGYLLRNGAIDIAPATEVGEVLDLQVDALANTYDAQFDEVIANEADLVISLGPDPFTVNQTDQPSDIAAFAERPDGTLYFAWANGDLANDPLALGEVDALELWSGVSGAEDDAVYFSLQGDGRGA